MLKRDAGRKAGKERLVAEERDRDDVGDHRRQHDGEQRVDRELAQDDLHAEEHAGDRRVERGGDAARGAAGDHDPQPVLRQLDPLADAGGQRGADLHDRPLAAHRAAEPMHSAEARDLTTADLPADPAAVVGDRDHHLGHAVPARFRAHL